MPVHKRQIEYSVAGAVISRSSSQETEEIEFEYEADLIGGAADVSLPFAIADTSKVKSILLAASGADVQFSTNDTWAGTPQDTFLVPAGGSFSWTAADPTKKAGGLVIAIGTIFSAAVTSFHVKNTSGTVTAHAIIRLLVSSN